MSRAVRPAGTRAGPRSAPARAPSRDAHPLKGRRAWLITDGKVGDVVQVEGVARALRTDYEIKRVKPRGPWRMLAPWIGVDPRQRFGRPGSEFAPPWPDIALATGRRSIPAIRAVKKASPLTYTVIIKDPRTGPDTADLIAVPAHDELTGDNVFYTLTAPHVFSQARLAALRKELPEEIAALPAPRVAVILGGPNAVYAFTRQDSARLAASLASLAALGASLLITSSRRTPAHACEAVLEATREAAHTVWDGGGANPYESWLAHCDMFIVTADSINITGEACATAKPVYVFEPAGGSPKFRRFHETLRRYGATKPLPERFERLENWTYAPLDSAGEIAAEIERRWRARSPQTAAAGQFGGE